MGKAANKSDTRASTGSVIPSGWKSRLSYCHPLALVEESLVSFTKGSSKHQRSAVMNDTLTERC